MSPDEFRQWWMLHDELRTPDEEDTNAWQDLLWQHLESQNHVSTYQDTDYSDAIVWAAFWIALGTVLAAWLLSGRPM